MRRFSVQIAMWALLLASSPAFAQRLPVIGNMTPAASMASPATVRPMPFQPVVVTPVTPPCARFVEPFDIEDYAGPLNKIVAHLSQSVDSATVHVSRSHPGLRPCAMDAGDKFRMFLSNSSDPLNFMGAAWDAAWAQMASDDATFRQGASGYGRRYRAALTDNLQGEFFSTFLYPAMFHQDPRYYRMGEGPKAARLGHALAHRFVAHSDSGKRMFNYSEWLGTASSKALSNLYHPGNARGFGPTASRVGFSVANDMAWDVLREFWPEVARKFHLPFRTARNRYIVEAPAPHAPAPAYLPAAAAVPASAQLEAAR